MVRDTIGPVVALKLVLDVPMFPKTRSGKALHRSLRELAEPGSAKPPSTIKDAGALDAVRGALAATDQPFRNTIVSNGSDDGH